MASNEPSLIAAGLLVALSALAFFPVARAGWFTQRAFERSPRRETGLTAIDLALGIFVLLMSIVAAGLTVRRLFPELAGESGDASNLLTARQAAAGVTAQFIAQGPAAFFTLLFAARVPRGVARLGLALRCLPSAIPWAIGAFIVAMLWVMTTNLLTYTLSKRLGAPLPEIAHDMLDAIVNTPSAAARWTMIASAILIAPILEEILYRGLFQTTLLDLFGRGRRWAVILFASVIFVAVHLGAVHPAALPGLFVLSIVLGWLYERTGALWPCILVHMIFNGVNVLIAMTQFAPAPP